MNIWLQSSVRFDDLVELDTVSGAYSTTTRSILGDEVPSRTDGKYCILSSVFIALYRYDDRLYIRFGDECFHLTDDLVIAVKGDTNSRVLTAEKSGEELFNFKYHLIEDEDSIPSDPTPFIEDEDFDFGLYLSNISTSEERKRVLLIR